MTDTYYGELFRVAEGKRLRDQGIAAVKEHNEPWFALCLRAAEQFVNDCDIFGYDFTGEEIRFHCQKKVGCPQHPNAWGALINSLVTRKIIKPTGQWTKTTNETSHARQVQVYERCH